VNFKSYVFYQLRDEEKLIYWPFFNFGGIFSLTASFKRDIVKVQLNLLHLQFLLKIY